MRMEPGVEPETGWSVTGGIVVKARRDGLR
jgi:hypothetical protein